MLDEMIKEGCSCNYFWTDGDPLTLQEFNKKYPNIKRKENKEEILNDSSIDMILISSIPITPRLIVLFIWLVSSFFI